MREVLQICGERDLDPKWQVFFSGLMYNILANFAILKNIDEPKMAGVRNGYAPHHKFAEVEYLASGIHYYDDGDFHFPGEIIKVRISFASWNYFSDKVKIGDEFEVRENSRLIGYGRVEEIF